MNCWQALQCGKEKYCPAYPSKGSTCWNVVGTVCCAVERAKYRDKTGFCKENCGFYKGLMLRPANQVSSER